MATGPYVPTICPRSTVHWRCDRSCVLFFAGTSVCRRWSVLACRCIGTVSAGGVLRIPLPGDVRTLLRGCRSVARPLQRGACHAHGVCTLPPLMLSHVCGRPYIPAMVCVLPTVPLCNAAVCVRHMRRVFTMRHHGCNVLGRWLVVVGLRTPSTTLAPGAWRRSVTFVHRGGLVLMLGHRCCLRCRLDRLYVLVAPHVVHP